MGWPARIDPIQMRRGNSRNFTFRFWSDPGKTQPIDLTAFGTTFAMQLRLRPGLPILLSCVIDSTNATTGVLTTRVTADQVSQLPIGRELQWDLKASDVDGDPGTTLLASSFQVDGEITG